MTRYEIPAELDWLRSHGAVRLLAHDPDRSALLLERALPGSTLSGEDPDDALDVLIGLLPRLWRPAGAPFRTLADESRHLADELREEWLGRARPFERGLF